NCHVAFPNCKRICSLKTDIADGMNPGLVYTRKRKTHFQGMITRTAASRLRYICSTFVA
ncbi:unnamed protein product, partial [Ilex paraguariensis]